MLGMLNPGIQEQLTSTFAFVVNDNLMKGAAGQAVQDLNLMCGFVETEGLKPITALS